MKENDHSSEHIYPVKHEMHKTHEPNERQHDAEHNMHARHAAHEKEGKHDHHSHHVHVVILPWAEGNHHRSSDNSLKRQWGPPCSGVQERREHVDISKTKATSNLSANVALYAPAPLEGGVLSSCYRHAGNTVRQNARGGKQDEEMPQRLPCTRLYPRFHEIPYA